MLIQRYNTFQQYWARITREIENGTYRRDIVRAAQRVGAHEALTIVGRRRAEKYALLADHQAEQRRHAGRKPDGVAPEAEELEELSADDLEEILSDPPPPPAAPEPSTPGPAPVKPAAKPLPLIGLGWAMASKGPRPTPAEAHARGPGAPSPAGPRAPAAAPREASSPSPAPTAVRSRLAELAQEMRSQRARGGAEPVVAPPPAEPPPDRARTASPAPPVAPENLPDQRLRQIYAKYVESKRAANESTAGLTYERLAESLRAQAVKLREKNPTKSVDYEVITKDGKTLLKPILK
jgi:hypothetical protein